MTQQEINKMNDVIFGIIKKKIEKDLISLSSLDVVIDRLISGFYSPHENINKYNYSNKDVVKLVISLIKNIPISRINIVPSLSGKEYIVLDNDWILTSLFFFIHGIFPKSKSVRKESYNFKEISNLIYTYNQYKEKKLKVEIKRELKDKYGLIFKNFNYNNIKLNYNDLSSEIKNEIMLKSIEFNIIKLSSQKESIQNKEIEFLTTV